MGKAVPMAVLTFVFINCFIDAHATQRDQMYDVFLVKLAPQETERGYFDNQTIESFRQKSTTVFRPGHRIVACFIFRPTPANKLVKFDWVSPYGMVEQSFIHVIERAGINSEYVAYAWLVLGASFLDNVIGHKFSGQWQVRIYVDGNEVNRRMFDVL